MVHFFWLCLWLLLVILMRFCTPCWVLVYFGSEMFASGDLKATQSIGIQPGVGWGSEEWHPNIFGLAGPSGTGHESKDSRCLIVLRDTYRALGR